MNRWFFYFLDQYVLVQHSLKHIDFLKIDVQGFEPEVLRGSTTMLDGNAIDVIKVEIMLHSTYNRISTFYEIENILLPRGYRLYDIPDIKKQSTNPRTLLLDAIYIRNGLYETLTKE